MSYITLLTHESYLPGALTLGAQLKHLGTKYPLSLLVDTSAIAPHSLALLEQVYDNVIAIDNELILAPLRPVAEKLGRTELAVTFTKLHLWNQTTYDKLVYLDADTLPLASLDDLFETNVGPEQIAASPDAGWPDIFNSGVLVLAPSARVFGELLAAAAADASTFDGADQGLLNEYFNLGSDGANWHRLPFVYNVTPNVSNHYQYNPAFARFADKIKLLHFIGATKPWHATDVLSSDLDNLHHYWWAAFNKHYGEDYALKYRILAQPRGEAYNLQLTKLANVWDTDAAGALEHEHETEPVADDVDKVFPWEQRGARPATRVFHPSTKVEPIADRAPTAAVDEVTDGLESVDISSRVSSLRKANFTDESSFNPDQALEEVARLPLKFMTKHAQKDFSTE